MRFFRPKSAAQSQAETTHMARRLFVSPPPRRMVIPILIFSAMEGYLLFFPSLDPVPILSGAVAIGLPAFVSAGLTKAAAESLGGRMYLRRSMLLAFVGLMVVGAFLVAAVSALVLYALSSGADFVFPLAHVAVVGYGAVLWVRQVILASTSNSNHLRSLPAAALHPGLGLLGLTLVVPFEPVDLAFSIVVLGIFLTMAIAFAAIAKRPLLRSFGIDGLKLLRHTLDHYTEVEESGVAELEAFFNTISVAARVRVGGVAFRSSRGLQALLLAPGIHPGPMGYVAGSDLPTKIARHLEDLTPNVLVAHGPTTHDENPATTAEIRKIPQALRDLLGKASFNPGVGAARRTTSEKASVLAQAFGNSVLLVTSFAPNPSDDVDSATGHAAIQEAKLAGAAEAVFVDAHNCLVPGAGLTHFGSPESHEILQAARSAAGASLEAPKERLRVGVGRRTGFCSPDQGIGARGIEALVVEAGDHRTAYVLFDGNNMIPGLRDAVRSKISGLVQESEVLTTDNHSVNLTMQGFNAVGAVLETSRIVGLAEDAVREAIGRLEEVEAAVIAAEIPGFRIFGPHAAARLTTSINSTMAVLRPALYVTLSGAIAASVLVLLLL